MANTPVPQYYRKAYQTFSGGLDDFEHPLTIKENQLATLDNALVNNLGILERAQGAVLDAAVFPNSTTSFIRMMVNYKRGTTVDNLVVAGLDSGNTNATYKVDIKQTVGDGNYNYIGYTAGTATFTHSSTAVTGSGTAWSTQLKAGDKIKPNATSVWYEISVVNNDTSLTLVSTFAETTQTSAAYMARLILSYSFIPRSAVFNNFLVITNGSEKPYTWDNSTTSIITSANAPVARFVEVHKNRVFMANTSAGPSTLYWSASLDQTTWSALSVASIYPQDNGNIVCIKSFADSLVVFKDQGKIYQVLGNFDQDVNGAPTFIRSIDVPDNLGVIAGYSVCVHDDGRIYFLCQTGIYAMDQRFQFEKVSWNINNDILNIVLRSAGVSTKSYTFQSQPNWDAGTHNGTVSNSTGLKAFNDTILLQPTSVSGSNIQPPADATIDSTNTIHATYLPDGSVLNIVYQQYGISNVVGINEIALSNITQVGRGPQDTLQVINTSVSPNGTVGIVIQTTAGIATRSITWRNPADASSTTLAGTLFFVVRTTSGNATFTKGSTAVTGSGTSWSTTIKVGDKIKNAIDGESLYGTVSAVTSDTSITLSSAYTGTSSSVSGYVAWSSPEVVNPSGNDCYIGKRSFDWNSSNQARIIYINLNLSVTSFSKRTGLNTWTASTVLSGTADWCSFFLGPSKITACVDTSDTSTTCLESSNDGTTWATIEVFTHSSIMSSVVEAHCSSIAGQTSAGHSISALGVTVGVFVRDHTAGVTTTVDANGRILAGLAATGTTYNVGYGTGTTITSPLPKIYYQSTASVSGTASGEVAYGFRNNGNVFAMLTWGPSTGQLQVRRIAPYAQYVSPEENDSTLTAWGTYTVNNEVDNGSTVTHQIAVSSTSTLPAPSTIVSGQIVNTDSTKIFMQFTITATMSSFSAFSIDSIIIGYTGSGVNAVLPTGYVYNSELYFACTYDGANNNDTVIFLDRKGGWGTRSAYQLTFFCRYKTLLYGGSAIDGNVYKLNSGYAYNSAQYTTQAVTKEDLLGSLELQKEIYKCYVIYKLQNSGTFNASYRLDNYKTPGGATWNITNVDQTVNGIAEIPVTQGLFSSIQFKFDCNASGASMGIIGMVIIYGYASVR